MNATSSLAPPMEDPFTDTMEMASPYQGHVDDFEIDIDIMEDQPTAADNDFDLQDASPAGDAPHDADMMEDAPEMATTDTSHYNDDSNMQYAAPFYSTEEPYESEMVDEEYETNNDSVAFAEPETLSIPPEQSGVASGETAQSAKVSPTHDEEGSDQQYENVVQDILESADKHDGSNQEATEQEPSVLRNVSNVAEPEVEPVTEPDSEHLIDSTNLLDQNTQISSKITATEEHTEAHTAKEVQDTSTDVFPAADTHEEVETERDALTESQVSHMHPVKVIYQENEISMFPPRDGDTSETYFLANEGLAHESIEGLLKECRAILGEHASPEDSLVFHVDSLGIELSDDDIHIGKVTLSKIVDIYLQLCRNGGVEHPEPLYLTLNTRANLPAEIAALLNAANEGKGISDIQRWEVEYEQHGYDDAGVSTVTGLSEQKVDEDEHDEQAQSEHNELLGEGKGNEWADGDQYEHDHEHEHEHEHEYEPGDEQETGVHEDKVEAHEHEEASRAIIESTELEHEEAHVASRENLESTSPQAISKAQYNFDETNYAGTLTQNTTAKPEDEPQDGLSTNIPQDEAEAVDEGLTGDENRDFEQTFEPGSHDEREAHEEYVADESGAVDKDKTGLVDGSEAAPAENVDYLGTNNHEDDKDIPGEEYFVNPEDEGQDEEDDHKDYEGYAEEESHEDTQAGTDTGEEFVLGREEPGEPSMLPHAHTEDTYEPDQLDQVSSDTVSVSNEPVNKHEPQLDDSQTAQKTDASEEPREDIQQSPDLPDLPDDDLISLGEDIFETSEEAYGQNTQHDNGLDKSRIDQVNDGSFDQVASADDDTQKVQLKRQGSNAGKRPRDAEEEDFGFDGTPSPGTKRTRSS